MECPRCKERLDRYTRFCPSCGLIVEDLVAELLEQEGSTEDHVAAGEDAQGQAQAFQDEDVPNQGPGDTAKIAVLAVDEAEQESADQTDQDGEDALPEAVEPSEASANDEEPSTKPNDSIGGPGENEPSDAHGSGNERAANSSDATAYEESARAPQVEADAQKDTADPNASFWSHVKSFVLAHKIVIIVAAGLLAVLIIAGVVVTMQNMERTRLQAESEAAYAQALNTPRLVAVELKIDNYSEEHVTPIPLRVTGTSTSGDSVDEVLLVTPQAPELSLLPGSYSVRLEGRPVSDQGVLYDGSIDTFTLEVPVENEETPDEKKLVKDQSQKPLMFVFAPIAPQNISEADIDAARAWMKAADLKNADAYADAVANSRNETLEHIEQEQATREEEGLKKVEDTTRQIENEIVNRKRKQQQSGQTSGQQNVSGSQNGYDEYGNYSNTYNDWYGYDSYGNTYDDTYGWANPWGY